MMRFNPQGTLLATVAGPNVELWDTVSHKMLAALPAADVLTDLAFTPDGRTLAVGGSGRTAATSVWRVSDSAARVQLGSFEARPRRWPSPGTVPWRSAVPAETSGSTATAEIAARHPLTSRPSPAEPTSRNAERERERERDRSRMVLMYD